MDAFNSPKTANKKNNINYSKNNFGNFNKIKKNKTMKK